MQPPSLPGECRVPGGLNDEAAGRIRAVLVVLIALQDEQMLVADVLVLRDACTGLVAKQDGGSAAVSLVVKPMGGYARTERLPIAVSRSSCALQQVGKYDRSR